MKIDIVTIFPKMVEGPLAEGIVARAIARGVLDDVGAIVRAVAPKPVNVVMGAGWATVDQLASAGVRRVSVGGGLARVAFTAALAAAREIREHGNFDALGQALSFKEMDGLFR